MQKDTNPMRCQWAGRVSFRRVWALCAIVMIELLALRALVAALAGGSLVAESSTPTIRAVASPSVVDVGDTVTVTVWLEEVENYWSIDFKLTFSPTLVSVPSGDVNPLWDVFDEDNSLTVRNSADNDVGLVRYALTNLNPAVPFTGTGRVCNIIFSADAAGTAALHFTFAKGVTGDGDGVFPAQADGSVEVQNPVPALASMDPMTATAAGPSFTLAVTGTDFVDGSQVYWDSDPLATTYVSGTELTATVESGDIATAGLVSVTVVNAGPGGGTSNGLWFEVQNPVPALASMNPMTATAGGPSFTLAVTGTGFVDGSQVYWDSAALATT
jgi:hypothetical protein